MIRKRNESSKESEVDREIDALLSYGAANMSFSHMALADEVKRRIDNDRKIDELTR